MLDSFPPFGRWAVRMCVLSSMIWPSSLLYFPLCFQGKSTHLGDFTSRLYEKGSDVQDREWELKSRVMSKLPHNMTLLRAIWYDLSERVMKGKLKFNPLKATSAFMAQNTKFNLSERLLWGVRSVSVCGESNSRQRIFELFTSLSCLHIHEVIWIFMTKLQKSFLWNSAAQWNGSAH